MSLSTLKDRFLSETAYQSSEGYDDKIDQWLIDALYQHAPTQTVDTLSEDQILPVVLLAWINLCYARASKFVNAPNQSGAAGYGTDRDSPYRKNMDMAAHLQKRYDQLVIDLGTELPGAVIDQSALVKKSALTDRIDSIFAPAIRISLAAGAKTATTVVLAWDFANTDTFADVFLYSQATPGIHQDWNFNTDDGIPFHSDSVEKFAQIQDPNIKSVKVTDLTPNSTTYFVAVLRNTSMRVYYSNEVAVVTPP